MERRQIMFRASDWMQARGWRPKLAKQRGDVYSGPNRRKGTVTISSLEQRLRRAKERLRE